MTLSFSTARVLKAPPTIVGRSSVSPSGLDLHRPGGLLSNRPWASTAFHRLSSSVSHVGVGFRRRAASGDTTDFCGLTPAFVWTMPPAAAAASCARVRQRSGSAMGLWLCAGEGLSCARARVTEEGNA